ncbi:MAG: DUF4265 domain-containing protein [Bacteroidota bacterium]
MTNTEKKHEKILFKYHSNVLDELTVESMWAEIIDEEMGIYKLDNIPFYGPLIATDDIFYAEFDKSEEMLVYKKTIQCSENSIVLVVITQKGFDKEILRNLFKEMNCESEGLNDSYFSMEILKETNYSEIKKMLTEYQNDRVLEYAEPCLSEKHQTDLT